MTKNSENMELLDQKQDDQPKGFFDRLCCRCSKSERRCRNLFADFYFPRRCVILILLFLGMVIINAQRVNIGVTVVAILHKTAHTKVSNPESLSGISNLKWTNSMVGWLHSMFYVGILISQVPCGYLVTKFPSHRLFGACISICCFLNLFLPLSITMLGYVSTCVIRLLQGLVEGMLYPSCYDVLRTWSLPEEKSRMGATVLTGSYIGPTVGMMLSGMLTHYWGWVYVFYIHGTLGLLWYIFWLFLAYESPSKHPTISEDEQKLILVRQGEATIVYEESPVPWKSIFTSLPVYSLIICNFARSSVFYMLLTNQPTYFHLFSFTFVENGLFSSLPHAFMALFCIVSGSVADLCLSRASFTPTLVRKLFTCIGFGVEAFFLFALALVDEKIMAVTFLTIAVGVSGIAISGWQINHLDLAPRYAGILVAITMTFGTLAGVLNPIIVAFMTEDQTLDSWHNVFWMTGAILLFATIFYGLFGSGERQPWATPRPPQVQVVNASELSEGSTKPYGTFPAQQTSFDSSPSSSFASPTESGIELPDYEAPSADGQPGLNSEQGDAKEGKDVIRKRHESRADD